MSGDFNLRNAAMAIAAGHFYQIPMVKIASALETFTGIKRRQEVRGEVNGVARDMVRSTVQRGQWRGEVDCTPGWVEGATIVEA